MTHFLYMSHISPYPPQGGEHLRAAGLIQALSSFGKVSAVLQSPLPEAPQDNISLFPFDFLSEMKPLRRYHQLHPKLTALLQSILQANPIDVVFIDYQFYGQYIDWFQKQGIFVIYGTHNAESHLTLQVAKHQKFFKKLEKWILFAVQRWHEKTYFQKADAFVVVSKNDASYYQHVVPAHQTWVIPNFIDPLRYQMEQNPSIDSRCLVMSGNFTNFQNSAGISWFLEKVWWELRLYEDYDLQLVGVGSERIKQKYSSFPNLEATGTVPSVSPYLQKAYAAIVPLHDGSGSRLKILEAMLHKAPIISTTLGAEGLEAIDSQHLLIANTPQDFVNQLQNLQSQQVRDRLVKEAGVLVEKHYSLEACTELLKEMMRKKKQF